MIILNIILKFFFLFTYLINEPEGGEKPGLLSVNPGLIIWTIIIFLILLFILKKWAWKPLLESFHNREMLIRESVEKAEQLKLEAERMLNENKRILENADSQSRKIINEGKEYAEKVRNDLIKKTNEDTNRMVKQAKAEIEREKLNALNELKDEVANLAVGAASKILDENLDENKQKKIVEGFIKQIPRN